MVGDQSCYPLIGLVLVAQKTRTIQWMETGDHQPGCVTDIVQDRRCNKEFGVAIESCRNLDRCSSNTLGVRPSSGKWQLQFAASQTPRPRRLMIGHHATVPPRIATGEGPVKARRL
ncbi:hypothetical protein GCM10010198_21740 [Nocardia seriolae]|nr:hypothetical protein NSER024013_77490 [Nocardia seriolae]